MDVIMFSHKTDSFIGTYYPFKHQMNKISLLVVLTLIFVILLTYGYRMTFKCLFGKMLDFFTFST